MSWGLGYMVSSFFRIEVLCNLIHILGFLGLICKMGHLFCDFIKWLGAPCNIERKTSFRYGSCPCKACLTGFSQHVRGNFCLGNGRPASMGKGWF